MYIKIYYLKTCFVLAALQNDLSGFTITVRQHHLSLKIKNLLPELDNSSISRLKEFSFFSPVVHKLEYTFK